MLGEHQEGRHYHHHPGLTAHHPHHPLIHDHLTIKVDTNTTLTLVYPVFDLVTVCMASFVTRPPVTQLLPPVSICETTSWLPP